ncbi:MAG: CRISPR-associated protein Cas4 [Candidatus Bathyarchaeia archaeon]
MPISDAEESYVSATDIKHYIYCPRIIYFEKVLRVKPVLGSQQEESREEHMEYVRRELRRRDAVYYSPEFIDADKLLFVSLSSDKLGLRGCIDCIIKTAKGEYIPVDYKNMESNKGGIWMDHKYQLTAYALLIEENYGTVVKRGFINYMPEERVLKLEITPTVKSHVKRILGHIKRMESREELPPVRVSGWKCTGGCGYEWICY